VTKRIGTLKIGRIITSAILDLLLWLDGRFRNPESQSCALGPDRQQSAVLPFDRAVHVYE
jgi:hypothetical protein